MMHSSPAPEALPSQPIDALGFATAAASRAKEYEVLGRLSAALAELDIAIAATPEHAQRYHDKALLLIKLNRHDEAIACLDRISALLPHHGEWAVRKATLLYQMNRRTEAFALIDRVIEESPRDLSARNTRGMMLDDSGHRAQALREFQIILAVNPSFADAITNVGVVHGRRGQFVQALTRYDESLAINPTQPSARYNRAVIKLVLGRLVEGFEEFESRWAIFPHEAARLTRLSPQWNGKEDISGKTVLLHHEQGYGDTLQFCRYVPMVIALGAKVIVAVPAALQKLMSSLDGSPRIISEGEPVPRHDLHCPLMSLPRAFGTSLDTIPVIVPYLSATQTEIDKWASYVGHSSRPRVGIVWSGRRVAPINVERDMSLELVKPLLAMPADFVCLHSELSAEETDQLTSFSNVQVPCRELTDFSDTAALIMSLDLVITVDTAVAHLAGALGKPVWIMNRYSTCWRWLQHRSDSPWYPTLRLFRQPELNAWPAVVTEVCRALATWCAPRRGWSDTPAAPPSRLPDSVALQQALDAYHGGHPAEALRLCEEVLRQTPDQLDALHISGVALAQMARAGEGLARLRRAAQLAPGDTLVATHLANTWAALGQHTEALAAYESALKLDSNQAIMHFNLGITMTALENTEGAIHAFTRALELNPHYKEAFNNRGVARADAQDLEGALEDYNHALQVDPAFVDALVNRAHLRRLGGRYQECLADAIAAAASGPDRADAHNAYGAALADLGRLEEALEQYENALHIDENYVESHWNQSLVQLSRGEFKSGWRNYEARWRVKSLHLKERYGSSNRWTGDQPVEGKTLLLHAEQGYGDTIQFMRFGETLAAHGARIIMSVPSALESLARSLSGVTVCSQGETPEFDLHCPLMSVPLALGHMDGDFPCAQGYLHADSRRLTIWRRRLGPTDHRLRVGLIHAGRPTHRKDRERSIALTAFVPLLDAQIRLINLQPELKPADAIALADMQGMEWIGGSLTDFDDTAAVVDTLDLLISVDTAAAHLAGALGRPVWVLLPFVSDWRWQQNRIDSPWYESATLYRQKAPGQWGEVIDRVRGDLLSLAVNERGRLDPEHQERRRAVTG